MMQLFNSTQTGMKTQQVPVPNASSVPPKEKKERIIQEMRALGVKRAGLSMSETKQLPQILHDSEHLKGVVYGRGDDGFVLMVATDHRVLFIDKKPGFMRADEVGYDLVGGVNYGRAGFFATVTVHTRIGDYTVRTMNFKSAEYFIEYIESRCLEREPDYGGF